MQFSEILGHSHIKKHLIYSADAGRIPHAQLFVGPEGSGVLPMAIAYAQYILCRNSNGENSGGSESCNLKFNNLSHPDLHFVYPVTTNDKLKKDAVSSLFLEDWRVFVKEQSYGNLFDWYQMIGVENKQGQIGVEESQEIVKALSLKAFEGGYKVMIMWMAEKMNIAASNKLLKLLEEPPNKTLFILIAEDEGQLLQTIRSRCQVIQFPPLSDDAIVQGLMQKGFTGNESLKIAHQAQGNFNKALDLAYNDSEDLTFEKWFIMWVRTAFRAKGNKTSIHDLLQWSEQIATTGRETQKQFLQYCMEIFRQALLLNYKASQLVYSEISTEGFQLEKFAPFVHGNNILEIQQELQNAMYHVERNGNAKIIFTDLSIKLTRLLHKPQ